MNLGHLVLRFFFLNSGNLICRSTGISLYLRESLGVGDNESRACSDLLYLPIAMDYPGPEVIILFLCSSQLQLKCFLLINVKITLIVGILTFMSGTNSILSLKKAKFLYIVASRVSS